MMFFQEIWELAAQGELQGIWFWAALYMFVVCTYSLVFQFRTRSWPTTQGELLDSGIEEFDTSAANISDREYVAKALYRYHVDGETYEGSRVSPWLFIASHNARIILKKQMSAIQRYPDGRVRVFYNPKKPKKSFLIVANKVGLWITFAVGVLPLVLFYSKFYG